MPKKTNDLQNCPNLSISKECFQPPCSKLGSLKYLLITKEKSHIDVIVSYVVKKCFHTKLFNISSGKLRKFTIILTKDFSFFDYNEFHLCNYVVYHTYTNLFPQTSGNCSPRLLATWDARWTPATSASTPAWPTTGSGQTRLTGITW